jgi:hypothetical protein
MGVKAPSAAAVAAATAGFAMLLHMPNGSTFRNGTLSMMLAAGAVATTRFLGSTANVDGAAPIVHLKIAPATANCAI